MSEENIKEQIMYGHLATLGKGLEDLRKRGEGFKIDEGQPVFNHLDPDRYKEVEELVSANTRMAPSVARYRALCAILSQGFKCAYEPPIDFDLAKRNWLSACLEMMRENPLLSPANDWKITLTIPDTQIIMEGFSRAIRNMIKWADEVRQTEPLADLEEWGGLVEAIYRTFVFGREVLEKGKPRAKITDDVLFRQNSNGNLVMDDRNIVSILAVCENCGSTGRYKEMQPPVEKICEIDIANCAFEFDHIYICQLSDAALRVCHQELAERVKIHDNTDDISTKKAVLSFTSEVNAWFDYYVKEYCNPALWHLKKVDPKEIEECDLPTNFKIMEELSKYMCNLLVEDTNRSKASLRLLTEWDEIKAFFAIRGIAGSLPTFPEQMSFYSKLSAFMQHYYEVASSIGCNSEHNADEEEIDASNAVDKQGFNAAGRADSKTEIPKSAVMRTKGICPYSGNEVHQKIFVDPGVLIKVHNKKYEFTGGEQWAIVNRFLRSLKEGADNTKGHFPVDFSTLDRNKCHGNCRAFINDFVERQPAAVRVGNTKFENRARFMIEKLN